MKKNFIMENLPNINDAIWKIEQLIKAKIDPAMTRIDLAVILEELLNKTKSNAELYAIRNKEGKWFRTQGFSGRGNWVDNLVDAKIYPKIGQARSRVTFFANNYPDYGVPELIKLSVGKMEVMDETKRVEKAKASKKSREDNQKYNNSAHWAGRLLEQKNPPTRETDKVIKSLSNEEIELIDDFINKSSYQRLEEILEDINMPRSVKAEDLKDFRFADYPVGVQQRMILFFVKTHKIKTTLITSQY